MGTRLQRLPVGGSDVPIDDGAVGLRDLAIGDARRLHGIIDVDAAHQKQRAQYHSKESLHDILLLPPITRQEANGSVFVQNLKIKRRSTIAASPRSSRADSNG